MLTLSTCPTCPNPITICRSWKRRRCLKTAIGANRSLAELKDKAESIPNQSILINSLILREARASSEIENVITTNDQLFESFSAGDHEYDPQTKEVLRYREALWQGFNALKKRPLSVSLFLRLVRLPNKMKKVSGTHRERSLRTRLQKKLLAVRRRRTDRRLPGKSLPEYPAL